MAGVLRSFVYSINIYILKWALFPARRADEEPLLSVCLLRVGGAPRASLSAVCTFEARGWGPSADIWGMWGGGEIR